MTGKVGHSDKLKANKMMGIKDQRPLEDKSAAGGGHFRTFTNKLKLPVDTQSKFRFLRENCVNIAVLEHRRPF